MKPLLSWYKNTGLGNGQSSRKKCLKFLKSIPVRENNAEKGYI